MIVAALLLAACGGDAATADDGKLAVVTTTGQIGDIVRNVGGDAVTVTTLMGPGVDPHLYVASEGDVAALQDADIIFYSGLFLEAQMDDVLHQIGERKPSVAVAEVIDRAQLLPIHGLADEYDPHVWFDVALWAQTVAAVETTLAEAAPAQAEMFAANAARYRAELDELDRYVREQAAKVPESKRALVTAHDAFHYFGRAYGFDVRGLQGISTASEASTADVRDLADFIAANQIPAIFVETSVPVRNIEALQAAVRDRGFDVQIGGQLYSDSLGDPAGPDGTFAGTVRHNIDTIVHALTGEQP
ncbi:MAG: zinc ABC transporter substrate-binding protein [Caldilineaceae bacterium]|nr:zinc ABC transporter substrate-binding protein [Caldilineaceae bacterium]